MNDAGSVMLEGSTVPYLTTSNEDTVTAGLADWLVVAPPQITDALEFHPVQLMQRHRRIDQDHHGTYVLYQHELAGAAGTRCVSGAWVQFNQPFGLGMTLVAIGSEELTLPRTGYRAAYSGEHSENVSEVQEPEAVLSVGLEALLDRAFAAAQDEQFEPGIESSFARELDGLFLQFPEVILKLLKERLLQTGGDQEALAEMLRWAGRRQIDFVRDMSVDLLSIGLKHKSSLVRDAAAVGLAQVRGPAAKHYLKKAIEREVVAELREDLIDLVASLEQ